jgi:purine-binding chemotaxis protein CheW
MGKKPQGPLSPHKGTTDWDTLYQRLAAARTAVSQGVTPDVEREILRKRAQALARQPDHGADTGAVLECLEFLLAYESYAIEVAWVAGACPLKDITPLPGTPAFMAGIINVRGRILSVIDIRTFFDLPAKGLTDLNKVVILQDGVMEFGILVDGIIGTRSIPLNEVQPPPATLTGIREEYLKGVTRERIAILDGKRLLNDRNLIIDDAMEA